MPVRKTARVELLARDALNKVRRPYGEDVILDVFGVIEADEALLKRYSQLKSELTERVVNPWIGVYTKELTGMDSVSRADTAGSSLIKSYTKLRPHP